MAYDPIFLGTVANDGTGDSARAAGQKLNAMLLEVYTDAQFKSEKGAPSGYASLDGSGKIPTAQLPALAITETFVVASQAAMLALVAERGDIAIRTDLSKAFILSTDSPGTLADWKELLTPADTVSSVAGLTGAISAAALKTALTLVKADVGLGNVDNTSDVDKPVSTATQTALNAKAAVAHTHPSSDISDFSEAVDDRVGALLVAGTNVTLTYNDVAGTLTIAASGSGVGDGDYGDITIAAGVWTIDNDVVTNAKLANMAQGTVKLRAAGAGTGDPIDGTPAQLVTIIQDALPMKLIASGTVANGTSSLDLTLPADYSIFELYVDNFINNTDLTALGCRFDYGAGYVTLSNYKYTYHGIGGNPAAYFSHALTGGSYIPMTAGGMKFTGSYGLSGRITIHPGLSSVPASFPSIEWKHSWLNPDAGGTLGHATGAGRYPTTGRITGIRLFFASGTIFSGRYNLIGFK